MSDFMRFIQNLVGNFPLHIEIGYSKTTDWSIQIYKKGCAEDYPNSRKFQNDAIVCTVQSCDMELAFAKAHVEVKEWLSENMGGY